MLNLGRAMHAHLGKVILFSDIIVASLYSNVLYMLNLHKSYIIQTRHADVLNNM